MITSKLNDLSELSLPPIWERKIQQIIHDNKMLYEPWIESAESFMALRSRLLGRGYKNIPMGVTSLLNLAAYEKAPKANTSSCKIRKTMIRKLK